MKRLALFFSCLCLSAVSVQAQNWPQFRGPALRVLSKDSLRSSRGTPRSH